MSLLALFHIGLLSVLAALHIDLLSVLAVTSIFLYGGIISTKRKAARESR